MERDFTSMGKKMYEMSAFLFNNVAGWRFIRATFLYFAEAYPFGNCDTAWRNVCFRLECMVMCECVLNSRF